MPEDQIAPYRAKLAAENEFEVWPDNWQAVKLFSDLSTQWRAAPMGGLMGLDYAGVLAAFRIKGIARHKWGRLFAAVQIMESSAVDYFSEKRGAD